MGWLFKIFNAFYSKYVTRNELLEYLKTENADLKKQNELLRKQLVKKFKSKGKQ